METGGMERYSMQIQMKKKKAVVAVLTSVKTDVKIDHKKRQRRTW